MNSAAATSAFKAPDPVGIIIAVLPCHVAAQHVMDVSN
jgi:hypothetical protein